MEYYKVRLKMVDRNSHIGNNRKSLKNLMLYGIPKEVGSIIVCKTGFKFKELITGIEIPYIKKSKSLIFEFDKYTIPNKSSLFFQYRKYSFEFYVDEFKYLNNLSASKEEVEQYLNKHLNPDNIKSSSNYVDLKEEYRKKLLSLFEQGNLEYQAFLESESSNSRTLKSSRKKKRNEEKNKIKLLVKDYLNK